jgi:hypothetical protein
MILATIHYGMIDEPSVYRASKLMRYEFILLFSGLVCLFGVVILFVVNLFKRKWEAVAYNVVGFLSLSFAMSLDSPTLMYIT